MNKPKKSIFKRIIKAILFIILLIVLAFAALIGVLTVTEYRPDDVVKLKINNNTEKEVELGKEISIMSWNIGYGALGDNADFFMDGGKMVNTATKERLGQNLKDIEETVKKDNTDIIFFQEMDFHSGRSHYVNEYERMEKALDNRKASSMTYNFKVKFLPYPIPPIGHVESGLATFSGYKVDTAERIKLSSPFKWPVKIANLKRCLLISRLPIKGSDKELVLVNLHLEAFDDGSGKAAQTKMLKEIMDKEVAKGNYVIAGGDFNQGFSNIDSSSYPIVWDDWVAGLIDQKDIGEDYDMLMDNSAPTCRSNTKVYAEHRGKGPYQFFLIDGYIVSKNVKINSIKTENLDFKASDHNPVIVKFVLE